LNFPYLDGFEDSHQVTPKDYNQALLTIRESHVLKMLKECHYDFYNLSIFDFSNSPALSRESFLTMPGREVFLYNTLFERFKKDLLWNFVEGRYAIPLLKEEFTKNTTQVRAYELKKRDFNNVSIDSVMKMPFVKGTGPKFIYAHFYLPHPPFFYNENGRSNNLNSVLRPESFRKMPLFLSYLKYTNNIILKICNAIIDSSSRKPLVVLESDHGFADFEGAPNGKMWHFKNYTAFFFPDHDYTKLYDTLSNINTFPLIFNKYFHTNIPLQKDSSIFLSN
jgi:hypothetical protein